MSAAASVGVLAWSGPAWAISVAVAMPLLWAQAGSQIAAGGVVLTYQLAATRGLPGGVVRYYDSGYAIGIGLWLAAGALVAGTWALCWRAAPLAKFRGACLAQLLVALPPIGLVGWVHPLTAAGTLFPGTRWIGLGATALLLSGVAVLPRRYAAAGVGIGVITAALNAAEPRKLAAWVGVDTALAPVSSATVEYERHLTLQHLVAHHNERVVVLPETVAGFWSETAAAFWGARFRATDARAVLLGAESVERDGRIANALVLVTSEGSRVVYRQRMPVPVAMWRPWSAHGTHAYGWRNPVVPLLGRRAAVFICYEQLLVWPVLHSFANGPDLLIGCANVWWCTGTTIPLIQRNTLTAWSRLFDVPCVSASNFAPVSAVPAQPIVLPPQD